MRKIDTVSHEHSRLIDSFEQMMNTMNWSHNQTDLIIGGDFNTKIDINIEKEPKIKNNIEKFKRSKLLELMSKLNLIDSYRSDKNNFAKENHNGFTFTPSRVRNKPSRIDYILISKHLETHAKKL